ncbi:endonuclease/exonuclease/phosphatase family protein [Sunxiuqinia dokdonensis]|uniref:Endonuclease n=1 Tax=Sunxiuqinia dokdonensis TaxID=1409788 RepID=A0A0L8V2W3_9BACT|nr:endonuclease/exonuclease/phosphatase family protein [Sunxiuqinia dokdonensis]KOH42771.1 endonuclease [Sunxiuqinia dokdonensis]
MSGLETILLLLSATFVVATIASRLKWTAWWIRVTDFPRLQITTAMLLILVLSLVFYRFNEVWQIVICGLLLLAIVYQTAKISRYTIFSPKQVVAYHGNDSKQSISLMVSNVLQTNRNSSSLLKLVEEQKPDLLLTVETDDWWEKQLRPLETEYAYTLKKPLDNLYGMILYSKLVLKNAQINYLIENNIPSIETQVKLRSGQLIQIYCLHPKPPFPGESETTTNRDGELLLIGKKIEKEGTPALVFGDFNDVAWSKSTRLFQKISGLLDPRIGRGFFNTFHAKHLLMRWPLDHIFHSSEFKLITIKRLEAIGSDHFPMYIHLHFSPSSSQSPEEPQADYEEDQEAREKIREANPKKYQHLAEPENELTMIPNP